MPYTCLTIIVRSSQYHFANVSSLHTFHTDVYYIRHVSLNNSMTFVQQLSWPPVRWHGMELEPATHEIRRTAALPTKLAMQATGRGAFHRCTIPSSCWQQVLLQTRMTNIIYMTHIHIYTVMTFLRKEEQVRPI